MRFCVHYQRVVEFTHVAVAFKHFHDVVVLHRVAFSASVEVVLAFFGDLVVGIVMDRNGGILDKIYNIVD